jgi:hypothetical protein
LKATAFNPWNYKVKTRFQPFAFKFKLYRYIAEPASRRGNLPQGKQPEKKIQEYSDSFWGRPRIGKKGRRKDGQKKGGEGERGGVLDEE